MNITKQKNEEVFGRFLSGNGDSDRMIGNKGQSVDAGLKFNSIEERKKNITKEWSQLCSLAHQELIVEYAFHRNNNRLMYNVYTLIHIICIIKHTHTL